MKLAKTLSLAVLLATSSMSFAAAAAPAPAPAQVLTVGHVRAVTSLMAAMQVEKMMKTIAHTSRYASDAQRASVLAKLAAVPPAEIHARLGFPVARFISAETATEMARFYATPNGQMVVHRMYNSTGGLQGLGAAKPTAAESKDMQRPAFIKANREVQEADAKIRHEAFVLMQAISKR